MQYSQRLPYFLEGTVLKRWNWTLNWPVFTKLPLSRFPFHNDFHHLIATFRSMLAATDKGLHDLFNCQALRKSKWFRAAEGTWLSLQLLAASCTYSMAIAALHHMDNQIIFICNTDKVIIFVRASCTAL